MRAYIEHGMHTIPQPVMFYHGGPFFRHENPQRGRLRELRQFGVEVLGTQKVSRMRLLFAPSWISWKKPA